MKPKKARPSSKPQGARPRGGSAGHGKAVDPTKIKDEHATPGAPRGAPAPGVPMSDKDYDALKERAKTTRLPPSKHQQEDPSGNKRK
jgi:hypothetical protein